MQGELNINNFRITGLPSNVPDRGSDALSWNHAVQLVRDSEADCSVKVNKAGDTMTGDLILSATGDTTTFGCSDLSLERTFSVLLGTSTNRLYFTNRQNPVVLETDHGLLTRTRQQRICQLDPSEVIIHKNVRMKNKRITSLILPVYPHEAANKQLYVDRKARKVLQVYVPNLRSISTTRAPNDTFGYVVTATSYLGNHYKPINAFNGTYSSGTGAGGEWVNNSETRNFCIQIKCPDIVRL